MALSVHSGFTFIFQYSLSVYCKIQMLYMHNLQVFSYSFYYMFSCIYICMISEVEKKVTILDRRERRFEERLLRNHSRIIFFCGISIKKPNRSLSAPATLPIQRWKYGFTRWGYGWSPYIYEAIANKP